MENRNEGNPDQHDGVTITFAGSGLQSFSKIRLTNKLGRFHLTGLAFTPNQNEGTEGVGMVHSAQISDLGSGIPTPTGTGASGTWGINITGTATNQSGGTVNATTGAFSGDLAVGTSKLFVDVSTGNVGIGTASPGYKLDVNGIFQIKNGGFRFGDTELNYIRLKKYFDSGFASNWKIASGPYTNYNDWQTLRICAHMNRIDQPGLTAEFDVFATSGNISVKNYRQIGGLGGYTIDNAIKIYTKASNSTYEIYLQIDSYTSVDIEISYRGATIDETYAAAIAGNGNIVETGLVKVFDTLSSLPDFKLLDGNVGIGTGYPIAKLDVNGTIRTSSTSTNIVTGSGADVTVNSTTPTTFASVTITTRGNKVLLICSGDLQPSAGTGDWLDMQFYRNTTAIGLFHRYHPGTAGSTNQVFAMHVIDQPSAGTYTYYAKGIIGSGSIFFGERDNPQITAIEFL